MARYVLTAGYHMTNASAEARVLGDFILGAKLGEGGFGTVYRAHQTSLDRPAVIKTMRASLSHRRDAHARFIQEARLASRFDHPYAAHVYAFGAEPEGELWIAMELVRGTPLSDMIAESGALPLERAIPLIERLCEVIQAAHDQGIVHRDIKPSNVMIIARSGRLLPKLLDFGIAKAVRPEIKARPARARAKRASTAGHALEQTPVELDHTVQATLDDDSVGASSEDLALTNQGQVLGSPIYMSPEQWLDASSVGPWSDQYALAILAFEMLTGTRPFTAGSISELAAAHVYDPFPALPSTLPKELDAVFVKATAKDPAARFPNLLAFAAALRSAAAMPQDVEAKVELPTELLTSWTMDAPRPIADAIVALTAARSSVRIADRAQVAGRVIAHWLGVVALASRSRLGRIDDDSAQFVRELRRRTLREEEWIEVAGAVVRPFSERAAMFPVPELVELATSPALATLRALVRGDTPLGVISDAQTVEHHTASARVSQLVAVLEACSWLLDYELVRATADHLEVWMGVASNEPVQHPRPDDVSEGQLLLRDADGARVALLDPLVAIDRGTADNSEQVFVFMGPGRTPDDARFVAPVKGFEVARSGVWSWLGEHLLEVASTEVTAPDDERPPYPGLAAFTAEDRGSYVGREREVEELVNRLRVSAMVGVIGPSGTGKSSFLAAGVIPALPSGWRSIVLRPGRHPLAALAAAVTETTGGAPYRGGAQVADPQNAEEITGALRGLTKEETQTVVVVVDQGEELFTLCGDVAQREEFAAALTAAAETSNVRVVIGVRDDFFYRLDELAPWRGRFAHNVQILRALDSAELERVVGEPLRRRGYVFDDPTMPAEIAREIAGRPGAMSLVAFTGAQLWARRDRHFKRLTREAYSDIGGVRGALVKYADDVVENLPATDRRLLRLAFRRLLTAEGTRAVVPRADLITGLGSTPAAERVVESLLESRLVAARDDDEGSNLEIVHEALTVMWPRLAAWRHEDNADLRLHRELTAIARTWQDRGRPADLLWRSDTLAELRRWRARSEFTLTDIERAFADASEAAARRARRVRLGVIGGSLAMLSTGVVVLSWMNRVVDREVDRANHELGVSLEDQARAALEAGDPMRGLAYLLKTRWKGNDTPAVDYLVSRATAAIESERDLIAALPEGTIMNVDAATIVAIDAKNATVWDRATGTQLGKQLDDVYEAVPAGDQVMVLRSDSLEAMGREGGVHWRVPVPNVPSPISIQVQRDVVAVLRGTVTLWNAKDGTPLGQIPGAFVATALDPSGERVVTGEATGTVKVWDHHGDLLATCDPHTDRVNAARFSPDGRVVATAGADRDVRICDVATGRTIHHLEGHANSVEGLEYSPDGNVLASTSTDSTVRLWNTKTETADVVITGHHGLVKTLQFSANGTLLLTGGADGTSRVWQVATGTELAMIQTGGLMNAAWETGERAILTSSHDGTIRRWDLQRASRVKTSKFDRALSDLTRSFDEKSFVLASPRGVTVIDAGTTEIKATIPIADATSAQLSPDGQTILAIDGGGHAGLYALDGTRRSVLPGDNVVAVAFANDGDTLITADSTGNARLFTKQGKPSAVVSLGYAPSFVSTLPGVWIVHRTFTPRARVAVIDQHSGAVVATLTGAEGFGVNSAYHQNVLAVTEDHDIALFDTRTWLRTRTLHGHKQRCIDLQFLPDGRLISSAWDRSVIMWNQDGTNAAATSSSLGAQTNSIATSFDGTMFATLGQEGIVRIWDARTHKLLESAPSHQGEGAVVRFAPDDSAVISAGYDGEVVRRSILRPHRELKELESLVRCRVPLLVENDKELVSKIPDFTDSACKH